MPRIHNALDLVPSAASNWVQCRMTVTQALRRWRREDQKFKVSLSYIVPRKLGLNRTLSGGGVGGWRREEGRKPTEPSMVVDIGSSEPTWVTLPEPISLSPLSKTNKQTAACARTV